MTPQTKNMKSAKISWFGGPNRKGYITAFRRARKGSKTPTIGSALYEALSADGQRVIWSERRAMPEAEARERGLIR